MRAGAAFDRAAAMYHSPVTDVLQNVANAVHALQSEAETLKAAVAARRPRLLGLLTAENTCHTARLALAQAQGARYADTAALFQALGGGWWNRTDAPPAKKWMSSSCHDWPGDG